jgi:hypothetical protein
VGFVEVAVDPLGVLSKRTLDASNPSVRIVVRFVSNHAALLTHPEFRECELQEW